MRIDLTYDYLTRHVVPGPQSISYIVPHILLPIALSVPRSILSRWQNICIFIPIMTACTIHAWWSMNGVDVISVDVLLWALFLLLCRDPWRDFKLLVRQRDATPDQSTTKKRESNEVGTGLPAVQDGDEADEQTTLIQPVDQRASDEHSDTEHAYTEQSYPTSLWQRLLWAGTLLVSIRLNGWKINSASHDRGQPPPPAFQSRLAFLAYSVVSFIRGYLVLDLTRAYVSYDPFFTDLSVPLNSPLPFAALWFIPPQLLRTMIVGAQAWALISQMFYLPCLLPVAINALGLLPDEWSPHHWPPYFGSPQTIFVSGVRGFWGKYWHSTMKWSVSGFGYVLANLFGLRSGGLARYAVLAIVAFGLSGTVHMGLVPPEPLHAVMNVGTIRLLVAAFFWVQPIAMVIETIVARLVATTVGLTWCQSGNGMRLRMLVNGIWVIGWFTISLSLLAEAGRQLGYWRVWPMPVSVWKGLRGEGWITWPFLLA